jgi:hypothetical protein
MVSIADWASCAIGANVMHFCNSCRHPQPSKQNQDHISMLSTIRAISQLDMAAANARLLAQIDGAALRGNAGGADFLATVGDDSQFDAARRRRSACV